MLDVIALQEQAGCPVVTDGELRRESFQSELVAAVDGFEGVTIDAWLWGDWHSEELGDKSLPRPPEMAVTSPLRRRRGLAAEELTFLRAHTTRIPKVTLPSPTLFGNLWTPERSREAYPTFDAFMEDVVAILVDEVRELARLGATYLQLDAPHYPLLIDPKWRAFYEQRGWSAERWLSYGIELDNAVIDAAPGVTFGFHLCRGNQDSRWLVAGGYEEIAAPVFGSIHAHRLLLEYDDERSGDFDPLRAGPRRQAGDPRAGDHQGPAARDPRGARGARPRGRPRHRSRAPGDRHPVRLLDLGRGQRPHRRGRAAQARGDLGHRGAHLGLATDRETPPGGDGAGQLIGLPMTLGTDGPVLRQRGLPRRSTPKGARGLQYLVHRLAGMTFIGRHGGRDAELGGTALEGDDDRYPQREREQRGAAGQRHALPLQAQVGDAVQARHVIGVDPAVQQDESRVGGRHRSQGRRGLGMYRFARDDGPRLRRPLPDGRDELGEALVGSKLTEQQYDGRGVRDAEGRPVFHRGAPSSGNGSSASP